MSQQRVIPSSVIDAKKPNVSTQSLKQREVSAKTTAFFLQRAFEAMFGHLKASAARYRSGWSRYKRHQGTKEKARRIRQIDRGILQVPLGRTWR